MVNKESEKSAMPKESTKENQEGQDTFQEMLTQDDEEDTQTNMVGRIDDDMNNGLTKNFREKCFDYNKTYQNKFAICNGF